MSDFHSILFNFLAFVILGLGISGEYGNHYIPSKKNCEWVANKWRIRKTHAKKIIEIFLFVFVCREGLGVGGVPPPKKIVKNHHWSSRDNP